MNQEFNFFKTKMPKTRKADFYLGCLDSSIYIDFNLDENHLIYLKRISFDGYGCCTIENSKTLDKKDSIQFQDEMSKDSIDQIIVEDLVRRLINLNTKKIWTDALKQYKILEK